MTMYVYTNVVLIDSVLSRFHLMEYPDYKYQPRKRSATSAVGTDTPAGTRSPRRSVAKRLRTKSSRKKSATKPVPYTRSETPVSCADSDMSERAESYLSSDWSVADDLEEDEYDLDVTGTYVPTYISDRNPSAESSIVPLVFSLPSTQIRGQVLPKEPLAVLPTSCGRSSGSMEAFDWMEDYMTPEVVDLLADDWFVAADNICLRDVAVM